MSFAVLGLTSSVVVWSALMQLASAQICGPVNQVACRQQCVAKGDTVRACQMDAACKQTVECQCDKIFSRCMTECTEKGGISKCECTMGVDTIVCADDAQKSSDGEEGGLSGGAIAGIVIGIIVGCVLCVLCLAFVWSKLPDADEGSDDEYNPNSTPARTEAASSPSRSSNTGGGGAASASRNTSVGGGGGGGGGGGVRKSTDMPEPDYTPNISSARDGASARDGGATAMLDDMLNDMPASDDYVIDAGPEGYSSAPPGSQQRSVYATPANMAENVDESYFMNFDDMDGNGDEFYGKLPQKPAATSAADKKRAAVEAAKARAAAALAERNSNPTGGGGGGDADDLKRRRQEILRKKKEELMRKREAAAAGNTYKQLELDY